MLKRGHALVGDAEDLEEVDPEGLPWLSSLAASAQVRLKVRARDLISFQERGMGRFWIKSGCPAQR